ncbi:MAG: alpha/beta hydrolase [Alphaproteobacteria bacterium]
MPKVRVGDIDIYYERKGDERLPRLLFISGTGGDLRLKPGTLDGVWPKHFDTLVYDQRGLGQSGKPDRPYTMADYADDAAGLMRAIGWQSARVIGVSFGGMVAQELVLRHPQMVERLVLACTSPGGAGGSSYPLHTIQHLSAEERARHMVPISDTRHDTAWAKAHPSEYRLLTTMINPYAGEPGYAVGAARQIEARAHHDTWDRLPQIRCPVLIAGGLYDGMALPETQEKMARRIPRAELQMFEGGHGFMMQDARAVPALISFLERKDI